MTPDWPYDPGKLGPQERWLVWCPRLCSLRLSLVSQLSYIPTGTKWTSSTTFDLEYKWLSFSLFLSAQVLQPRTCFKIKSHCWQENLCPHVGFPIPHTPQKWPRVRHRCHSDVIMTSAVPRAGPIYEWHKDLLWGLGRGFEAGAGYYYMCITAAGCIHILLS